MVGRTDGATVLSGLLRASHLLAPAELPDEVQAHARRLGAREVVIYLADYEQQALVPLRGVDVPARESLRIDTTLPGQAFRRSEPAETASDGEHRLWMPLLDGADRVGVLEVVFDSGLDVPLATWRDVATLVTELVVTKSSYTDEYNCTRRRRKMTLAAEIQWQLLPPLTFSTPQVAISSMLEPSYEIGGDTFDYALDGQLLHVAIIDAMGHGTPASVMSSVAIGSYRHSRRAGLDLAATYVAMDRVLASQFGPEHFVTGQFGQLDVASGVLRWVNGGHPRPLLLRGGSVIGALACEPTLPIGLGAVVTQIAAASLEPGDRLLFFSDGVVEARSPDGEFFGDARLADHLERASAAGLPAAETVRRLTRTVLAHQDSNLQDDATMVLLEWQGLEA